MRVFDYIFYRIYDFYSRKEKIPTALLTASGYLSFLQFLGVYCLVMVYGILSNTELNLIELLRKDKLFGKALIFLIFVGFEIYNFFRYRKKEKQESLQRRFKKHSLNRIIKPWMFLVLGVFLFGLPILVHYLIK